MRKLKLSLSLGAVAAVMLSIFVLSSCSALGKLPEGERLERIEKSPNYRDGEFKNVEDTPMLTTDKSNFRLYWEFLFNDYPRLTPEAALKSVPLDKELLASEKDYLAWLGHSSLVLNLSGTSILIDPIFNDYASPVSFVNKAFSRQNDYQLADFDGLDLDVLLITHDHYDHLEMQAIAALKERVQVFICPLGVGAHLEAWGVPSEKIIERDWNESAVFKDLTFNFVTARHFSGRFLTRNQTLWTGYVISRPEHEDIYLTGDSGYGAHFKDIGSRFPNISLALVECGQYNANWAAIHMTPEESAQAAADAGAAFAIPLHAGRFALSNHSWDDPYLRFDKAAAASSFTALYPLQGEIVFLDCLRDHNLVKKLAQQHWWLEDAAAEQALAEDD